MSESSRDICKERAVGVWKARKTWLVHYGPDRLTQFRLNTPESVYFVARLASYGKKMTVDPILDVVRGVS